MVKFRVSIRVSGYDYYWIGYVRVSMRVRVRVRERERECWLRLGVAG